MTVLFHYQGILAAPNHGPSEPSDKSKHSPKGHHPHSFAGVEAHRNKLPEFNPKRVSEVAEDVARTVSQLRPKNWIELQEFNGAATEHHPIKGNLPKFRPRIVSKVAREISRKVDQFNPRSWGELGAILSQYTNLVPDQVMKNIILHKAFHKTSQGIDEFDTPDKPRVKSSPELDKFIAETPEGALETESETNKDDSSPEEPKDSVLADSEFQSDSLGGKPFQSDLDSSQNGRGVAQSGDDGSSSSRLRNQRDSHDDNGTIGLPNDDSTIPSIRSAIGTVTPYRNREDEFRLGTYNAPKDETVSDPKSSSSASAIPNSVTEERAQQAPQKGEPSVGGDLASLITAPPVPTVKTSSPELGPSIEPTVEKFSSGSFAPNNFLFSDAAFPTGEQRWLPDGPYRERPNQQPAAGISGEEADWIESVGDDVSFESADMANFIPMPINQEDSDSTSRVVSGDLGKMSETNRENIRPRQLSTVPDKTLWAMTTLSPLSSIRQKMNEEDVVKGISQVTGLSPSHSRLAYQGALSMAWLATIGFIGYAGRYAYLNVARRRND